MIERFDRTFERLSHMVLWKKLRFCLITQYPKKINKGRKKWKTFRLNESFRTWKQICEALLRFQRFYQILMHVDSISQTRFSRTLNLLFDRKTESQLFVSKDATESFKTWLRFRLEAFWIILCHSTVYTVPAGNVEFLFWCENIPI